MLLVGGGIPPTRSDLPCATLRSVFSVDLLGGGFDAKKGNYLDVVKEDC